MKYDSIASNNAVIRTSQALVKKGDEVFVVNNGKEALDKIKELIPQGASVMNGSSRSLEDIGFIEYLKSGKHGWNNLHEAIVLEKDPKKQLVLRKQALLSDYYLGSLNALTEEGEFIVASNTGSQLPQIVFSSPNLIFVVGTQKIVPSLSMAMKRLKNYVVPLENERLMQKFGVPTNLNKIVIFKGENPRSGRKITVILVKEKLGF